MFNRITFHRAVMGGRACIRGMRIPVSVGLLAEIRRLDAELSRLTAAIASGGDLPALLAASRRARRSGSAVNAP